MPKPLGRSQRYMPGIDGLRAVAVLGVIFYHVGTTWLPGGLLGVGVFFTLSGYLITDILLNQVDTGGVRLGSFWLARARRLLPALFLMLIVVAAWVTAFGPQQTSDFRTAALTSALYVNNWWLIFHDVSYFEQFAAAQPLKHMWSLSVEEQFYLVWPFLVIIGTRLFRDPEAPRGTHPRFALATLGLGLVSAILMVILYSPGEDPSRVYYGTDTRAVELLAGAALAAVWPSRKLSGKVNARARLTLDSVGLMGLGVILIMFLTVGEFSSFLYRGGFVILSIATALLVAALAHPASRLGPILGCAPMRWIGERSYGIYLWHFPVIVLTNPKAVSEPSLTRGAAQIAATFAIAALSWKYVEDPIRKGAIGRLWRSFTAGEWRNRQFSRPEYLVASLSLLVVALAVAGFAGVGVKETPANKAREVAVEKTIRTVGAGPRANRISCRTVVHIGDSTSLGLDSPVYLPDRRDRISHQYARVGATTQILDISGGRSIYERYKGNPNAREAAAARRAAGVKACWVLALGTNEAANVAAGSNVTYDDRVEMMMSAIGNQPVMWVNVKSLVPSGPYAAANMKAWDASLRRACDRYPNMKIYDWASEVRDPWFVQDGIHFTSFGYATRARYIADALLDAFPASGGVRRTDARNCLFKPRKHSPPRRPDPVPGQAGTTGTTGSTGTGTTTGTGGTTGSGVGTGAATPGSQPNAGTSAPAP